MGGIDPPHFYSSEWKTYPPHFDNVRSFLTLNTFSHKRRHRIENKFVFSVHYLLSGFHVDVIVFILSSFNVLLIGAFRDFPARSVVKLHTYVVDVASYFYLSWIYCRFPSSWIVFSAFCCIFWLDLCFVYGTMSPSDIHAHCSDRPAAPAAVVCARLRDLGI